MDCSTMKESLDAGYIEKYSFDIGKGAFTMRVDVLENDALSSYDVQFEKVSFLSFETESFRGEDSRLELTEIWIETSPETSSSEEWTVLISIWDLTHIRIRCSTIAVDGEMVR